MPMPQDYQTAQQGFDALLACIMDELDLTTRNQAYTSLQAALVVFRRRLTPVQVLHVAGVLPAMTRAIFVEGWQPDEFRHGFGNLQALTAEVQAFRANHNFSPDDVIVCVAAALRTQLDERAFDEVLATISPDAQAYWRASQSET